MQSLAAVQVTAYEVRFGASGALRRSQVREGTRASTSETFAELQIARGWTAEARSVAAARTPASARAR